MNALTTICLAAGIILALAAIALALAIVAAPSPSWQAPRQPIHPTHIPILEA